MDGGPTPRGDLGIGGAAIRRLGVVTGNGERQELNLDAGRLAMDLDAAPKYIALERGASLNIRSLDPEPASAVSRGLAWKPAQARQFKGVALAKGRELERVAEFFVKAAVGDALVRRAPPPW